MARKNNNKPASLAQPIDTQSENDRLKASYDLLEQRIVERTAAIQLLQDVAVAANEAVTVEAALQFTLKRICQHTGWPVGHVYIPDEEDPTKLLPLNIWHLDAPERFQSFCNKTQEATFVSGVGLPGKVFASGEPLWVMDVTKNSNFLRAKLTEDIGVKAGFAFPVWSGKEVVAVLEFFSEEAKEPDGALLEMMTHIGTQLGRVIERKRAEQVLQESEVKFRAIIQSAPEAIVIADNQGNIITWNKGAQTTFGYTEAEILGQSLTCIMPARYREAHQQGLERFISTGKSELIGLTLEFFGLKKDGSEFPVELSITTWKFGKIIFFGGIIRDISRRKRVEEQIRENQQQLAEAQAIAHVGSWSWDITTNKLSWSDELHRIYGINHQEFVASYEGFIERVHGDDRNRVRKIVEEAYDTLTPFNFEHRIVRLDGQIRILHARGRVVADETGRPTKMYGTAQDITERIQAQDALKESEARFRAIFEGAAIGIGLKDLDMRIIESNPALQKMLGYNKEELRYLPFTNFTHPDDVKTNIDLYQQLVAGKRKSYQLEKRYLRKDGNVVWARLTVTLMRNPENKPLFAIAMVEDITEHKQIEAELIEVQQRLMESREAERLHLARELHDGPLQDLHAIFYNFGELETVLQNDEVGLGQMAAVQATVQQVIGKLRAICGELRPPALAPFGLEKAIRSHAEQFQKTHPQLKITLNLMPDGQQLPEQMRFALFRIYQETLNNIARHAQAHNITIKFTLNTDMTTLTIQDDGQGFNVPKRRIELARQGHLGLVGANERAEAIGGHLKITSAPGEGCQIQVVVPRLKETIMDNKQPATQNMF